MNILDLAHFFKYPRERIRPGFTWKQRIDWKIPSSHFSISLSQDIEFKVVGYERRAGGFCSVIEWETNIKPQLIKVTSFAFIGYYGIGRLLGSL